MDILEEKRCTCCGQIKVLLDYGPNKGGLYGKRSQCRICLNSKGLKRYYNNLEMMKQRNKEYYQKNIKKIRDHRKEYRDIHREEYIEYYKQYYIDNKELINERNKKDYHDNKEHYAENRKLYEQIPGVKERMRIQAKKYRLINRERIAKNDREYMRLQTKLNTNYVKRRRLRSLIRASLKRKKIVKSEKSELLLGCTVKYAIEYLENLGYDNSIHEIDHIVPISRFDINNKIHRIVAFNYKNTRPLERSENRSKHKKLTNGWKSIIINICKSLNIESIEILNHIEGTMKEATA